MTEESPTFQRNGFDRNAVICTEHGFISDHITVEGAWEAIAHHEETCGAFVRMVEVKEHTHFVAITIEK